MQGSVHSEKCSAGLVTYFVWKTKYKLSISSNIFVFCPSPFPAHPTLSSWSTTILHFSSCVHTKWKRKWILFGNGFHIHSEVFSPLNFIDKIHYPFKATSLSLLFGVNAPLPNMQGNISKLNTCHLGRKYLSTWE